MIRHTDYIVLAPNAPIGTRIWFMRDKRGLTQAAVADALHINTETVKRWERSEYEPYPYQIEGLSKLFKVSTDWLLTGKAWE